MKVNGQVGPRVLAEGGETELRLGRTAALITSDGHGRYTEAAIRGLLFAVSTAVAGVAPGTVLSTTPPMALWNPPNSGVILAITKAMLSYISGTLGAGSIVYGFTQNQSTVPSGGTELTATASGLSAARSRGRAFQGSTLAATPGILLPMASLTAFLATTAMVPFVLAQDEVAGAITVPPGGVVIMQGVAAAGTTPLVLFGLQWEEYPVVGGVS